MQWLAFHYKKRIRMLEGILCDHGKDAISFQKGQMSDLSSKENKESPKTWKDSSESFLREKNHWMNNQTH